MQWYSQGRNWATFSHYWSFVAVNYRNSKREFNVMNSSLPDDFPRDSRNLEENADVFFLDIFLDENFIWKDVKKEDINHKLFSVTAGFYFLFKVISMLFIWNKKITCKCRCRLLKGLQHSFWAFIFFSNRSKGHFINKVLKCQSSIKSSENG